jgi:pimeloyl-ACP methyl ester carboxylesterase
MGSLVEGFRSVRRELRYLSGYLEFEPVGPLPRRAARELRDARRPVLLLHGFFSTRRSLEVLERRLRRDGYCVFSLHLGGFRRTFNTRGIDDLAEYVRTKVERIYLRNPGLGPLTIIGHSKGGLIGAYYVKRLGGWRRARALVTLGTPFGGTTAAYAALPIGLLAPSLWQMIPRSPFLRRLQRGPWPEGVRLVSIWSREDRVAPFPSAVIDTQGLPHVRNVEVAARGHREFLHKKRVYDAIVAELRAVEAAAPAASVAEVAPPGPSSTPPRVAAAPHDH